METEFKISNKETTSNNLFYQVNNHIKHGKHVVFFFFFFFGKQRLELTKKQGWVLNLM